MTFFHVWSAMAWKITSSNRSEKSAMNRWGIVGCTSRHRHVQVRLRATDRSRVRERMRTHKRRYVTWGGCCAREVVATGRDSVRRARHFLSAVSRTGLCGGGRGAGGAAGEDDDEEETHARREGRNVIGRARCTVIVLPRLTYDDRIARTRKREARWW